MKSKRVQTSAPRIDWRAIWAEKKSAFVDSAWHAYMREPWQPRYAYITKTDRVTWGELHIVRECDVPPASAELITAERIPAADRATIARWFERFAGALAVLPDNV
jgi:hypothetical protein